MIFRAIASKDDAIRVDFGERKDTKGAGRPRATSGHEFVKAGLQHMGDAGHVRFINEQNKMTCSVG